MPRLAVLFAALALPAAAQPVTGGRAWTTTAWSVECRPSARAALGDDAATHCDDANPVSGAAVNRYELEQASAWLKGLGLHAPAALRGVHTTRGAAYVAYVDPGVLDEGVLAEYDPDGSTLHLNTTSFLVAGGGPTEAEAEREIAYDRVHGQSAVHELFHAVQYQYSLDPTARWSGGHYAGPERDWIWEGTARAVEVAWARRTTGGQRLSLPRFHLDRPIHQPDRGRLDQYNLARFWLFAARQIGPASGPEDLGFLHGLLLSDLGPASGVRGVDAALRRAGLPRGGGLADLLTAYVADRGVWREDYGAVAEMTVAAGEEPATARRARRVRALAADPVRIRASVRAADGVALAVRVEGAQRPADLRLVVERERFDLPVPLDPDRPRNTFRTGLGPGDHTLFVRVVNAADDAAETAGQSYTLVVETEPLRPCSGAQMAASTDGLYPYPGVLSADAFDPDRQLRPGAGEMRLSGLAQAGGTACGFNLGEVGLVGQALTGEIAEDEMEAAMQDQAEALLRQVESLPPSLRAAMNRDAAPDRLSRSDRAALRELAAAAGEVTAGGPGAPAVLHLFSPHLTAWQAGLLATPFQTGHTGVAGWPRNAAAQVVLQFEAAAADLRAGQTYPVTAYASAEPPADGALPQVPTVGGFYTQWEGTVREIPSDGGASETGACALELAEIEGQLEAEGALVGRRPACGAGTAFEGESQVVTGTLRGSVTVTRVTRTPATRTALATAVVEGTFRVSGTATRHRERSRFTYDADGRLTGDETTSSEERGPLHIEGSFRAPASVAGVERGVGYRTVRLAP